MWLGYISIIQHLKLTCYTRILHNSGQFGDGISHISMSVSLHMSKSPYVVGLCHTGVDLGVSQPYPGLSAPSHVKMTWCSIILYYSQSSGGLWIHVTFICLHVSICQIYIMYYGYGEQGFLQEWCISSLCMTANFDMSNLTYCSRALYHWNQLTGCIVTSDVCITVFYHRSK